MRGKRETGTREEAVLWMMRREVVDYEHGWRPCYLFGMGVADDERRRQARTHVLLEHERKKRGKVGSSGVS